MTADGRQAEPRGQRFEFGVYGRGDGAGEADVLVDGVHLQDGLLAVDCGIDLADQLVMVQHRQGEVAPAPLRLGDVHLQAVFEVE